MFCAAEGLWQMQCPFHGHTNHDFAKWVLPNHMQQVSLCSIFLFAPASWADTPDTGLCALPHVHVLIVQTE